MEVKLTSQEEETLKSTLKVWQVAQSEGWQEVIRPYLEVKLNQSFPDPSKFTKEEEFVYAAKTASVFKKVIAELLAWVEEQIDTAKHLQAKKEGKIKEKFNIGG